MTPHRRQVASCPCSDQKGRPACGPPCIGDTIVEPGEADQVPEPRAKSARLQEESPSRPCLWGAGREGQSHPHFCGCGQLWGRPGRSTGWRNGPRPGRAARRPPSASVDWNDPANASFVNPGYAQARSVGGRFEARAPCDMAARSGIKPGMTTCSRDAAIPHASGDVDRQPETDRAGIACPHVCSGIVFRRHPACNIPARPCLSGDKAGRGLARGHRGRCGFATDLAQCSGRKRIDDDTVLRKFRHEVYARLGDNRRRDRYHRLRFRFPCRFDWRRDGRSGEELARQVSWFFSLEECDSQSFKSPPPRHLEQRQPLHRSTPCVYSRNSHRQKTWASSPFFWGPI